MEANELAFFGKIAAGVTHELKNVLAIINESNGLMADLIAAAKESPFPHRDRFLRSIGKIEEQVRRGVDITTRFNHFAHSVDHAAAGIDLNRIVAQTVELSVRFARLKNIDLRGDFSDGPVTVVSSPFQVQMALTKVIEACMGSIGGEGSIVLRVMGSRDNPALEFDVEAEEGPIADLETAVSQFRVWQEFECLASVLDLRVDWGQSAGSRVSLYFPVREMLDPRQPRALELG